MSEPSVEVFSKGSLTLIKCKNVKCVFQKASCCTKGFVVISGNASCWSASGK